MTVNTTAISAGPYAGNDIADVFSYGFRIADKSQLIVYETSDVGAVATLTVDTDYTVTGIGVDQGGTVTRVAGALPTGYQWYIKADYKKTQLTAFQSQGAFFPDLHEDAMDQLTFLIQQVCDSVDRSPRLPDYYSGDLPLSLDLPVPGQFLTWNQAGTGLINTGVPGAVLPQEIVANVVGLVASNNFISGDYVQTKGYHLAGDGGQASYLIKTAAEAATDGDVIDGFGNHTIASGDVAILQFDNGVYHVAQWGARGLTGVDDAPSFSAARDYIETITTKTKMQTLHFDVLNFMSGIVVDNYSFPFILHGNKIYDEYEFNNPCLIYGEDLSSNGQYEFQMKNFNIENRTTLVTTKTIGLLIYHSAYHVGIGITTTGFQIGHKVISSIGFIYDMQQRTSSNEITNLQVRLTGTRRSNLLQYRNHKHKVTNPDGDGICWDIEDAGGIVVEGMAYDTLPSGSRPFIINRAFEQSERNSCVIRQGWMENYGSRPAEIRDSIVEVEQYYATPRQDGTPVPPAGTRDYVFLVTGPYARVNAKNIFTSTVIEEYVFHLDTTTMTDDNLALCSFENVSGGNVADMVKSCNVQALNGGRDGYPHRFFDGGNANGFSFDLETVIAADDMPLPQHDGESTIEMELTGTTGAAMDWVIYRLGVRFTGGQYYCRSVDEISSSVSPTPVTVTFPIASKPTFTFDNPTGAPTGFASLTANFRFAKPASRFP